jgi:hypothetical protein
VTEIDRDEIVPRFKDQEIRIEVLRSANERGLALAEFVETIVTVTDEGGDMLQRIANGEGDLDEALGWWDKRGSRKAEALHAINCAAVRSTINPHAVEALCQIGDYKADVQALEALVAEIDI